MGYTFFEAKEEYFDGSKMQVREKYKKDYRGMFLRESMEKCLTIEPVTLSPEQERAVLLEANEYRLTLNECEYGDHDDMGQFGVDSSSEVVFLKDTKGILLKDGHFFGVYVAESALTINEATYGKCTYSKEPTRPDSSRTSYYRDAWYELSRKK